jgi:2'-5' RNA ligase
MISVSIDIPEPFAGELQRLRASFGDPLAESIPSHVTLLSPAEVDGDLMPKIHPHLGRVAALHRPFTMLLRSTGTFRPVSPVVFVQVAGGISECEQLERMIRTGPLKRVPQFYYHPHVTVAHHVNEAAMDRAFDELASYQGTFQVEAIRLYEHGADLVSRPVRTFALDAGVRSGSVRTT